MRKILLLIMCFSLFLSMDFSAKDAAQAESKKQAEILIENDSKTILHQKNAYERMPPASMTKIMTMLLVMEAIETDKLQLQEKITISERAEEMGGSQVFLEAGEQMTVEDLIKAVAIASANDASIALAEAVAGTEANFVKLMNEKVAELGLKNTHFVNPSGLPAENHYSSALTIINFHDDVGMHEVQQKIYYVLTGEEVARPLWMQIPYAFGLGIGMFLFVNRWFSFRLNDEPSPIEMEFFQYEQNVHQFISDEEKRNDD